MTADVPGGPGRSWSRLALGDGVTALEPLDRLRKEVEELAARGDRDGCVVLLARHDDAGLHCRVTAFFSPAAADVARAAGAVPCPPPPRAGLVYSAGHPCWEEALSGRAEGG